METISLINICIIYIHCFMLAQGRSGSRRDVQKGTIDTISEVDKDDPTRFLVSFPLDISKGKPRIVDVISSVVHTSLKIHKETDKGKAKDAKDEKSTLLKKYVFLEDNDKGTPTLINKWQTKQVEDDKHSKDQFMSDLRSAAMLACSAMQQTPLTTNDILIIRRELASQPMKKVIEIWTLQKFKKYTLVLTPYKCEIKERYWTLGRSVLIKNEEMSKSKNTSLWMAA